MKYIAVFLLASACGLTRSQFGSGAQSSSETGSTTGSNSAGAAPPAVAASLSVMNHNPTSNPNYQLVWTGLVGDPVDWCILENATAVAGCTWQNFPLPATYAVSSEQNPKVLSAWVRDAKGNVSARAATNSVALSLVPRGIYILDSEVLAAPHDQNIRDLPYVSGYVWRKGWARAETSEGVYDFSDLDTLIPRLQSIGQHLTILSTLEPSYIASDSYVAAHNIVTWQSTGGGVPGTVTRPAPWDATVQARYLAFVQALSDYRVADSTRGGQKVPLRDHPTLANISLGIPGLGEIRYNGTLLAGATGYSRASLMSAIHQALFIEQKYFPKQAYYEGFWGASGNGSHQVEDTIATPPLWQALLDDFLQTFDGIKHPRVSLWMENLAAAANTAGTSAVGTPSTAFANPAAKAAAVKYPVSFQMLTGWYYPANIPGSKNYPGQFANQVANSRPSDALSFAFNTYGALYNEIYVSDIDAGQKKYITPAGSYSDTKPGNSFNAYASAPSNATELRTWSQLFLTNDR